MDRLTDQKHTPRDSTAAGVEELLKLSEIQLQKWVIEPLLSAMGFENIKDSGGPRERGKDLVAIKINDFGRPELYAVQIKLWKPRGKSASRDSFGLLLNQLKQATQEDAINPSTHILQKPDKCIFFTPYPLPLRAQEDYYNRMQEILHLGVEIIDGPKLVQLLVAKAPETLENFSTDVQYRLRLLKEVTRIPESRAAFEGNDLDLARIYVEVSLHEDPIIEGMVEGSGVPCLAKASFGDVKRIRTAVSAFDESHIFQGTPVFEPPTYKIASDEELFDADLRLELRSVTAALSRYVEQRQVLSSQLATIKECTEVARKSAYVRKRLTILKKDKTLATSWLRLASNPDKEQMSLSLADLLRIGSPILILGGPGAGKTTAMRWLTRTAAEAEESPLPVLIPLAGLSGASSGIILHRCVEQLQEMGRDRADFNSRVGNLERWLKNGRVRLLLDGLDETGSNAEPFLRVFDELCTHYPRLPMIVSCRDTLQIRDWEKAFVVHLRAFSNERLEDFILKWFRVNARAKNLLSWLRVNPRMKEAARTPLIAALLCSLFAVQADMPTTEVDLYERRFELLLGRWEHAKGLPSLGPASRRGFLRFLRTLAFYLHCHERRTAKPFEALSIARFSEKAVGKDAGDIVEDCVRRGVLERQFDGQLSLGHLTYQEYLAACYLNEVKDAQFIWRRLAEGWWLKSLEFYAAKAENLNSILKEGLSSKDWDSMRILEMLIPFAPSTSKRLLEQLRQVPNKPRAPLSKRELPSITDLD